MAAIGPNQPVKAGAWRPRFMREGASAAAVNAAVLPVIRIPSHPPSPSGTPHGSPLRKRPSDTSLPATPSKHSTGESPGLARLAIHSARADADPLTPRQVATLEAVQQFEQYVFAEGEKEAALPRASGMEGPTLVLAEKVLKATDDREVFGNQVYTLFANGSYTVPESIAVDFKRHLAFVYGSSAKIKSAQSATIKENFRNAAVRCDAEVSPKRSVVMQIEKVEGESSFQALKLEYGKMNSEQKGRLLKQLGAVAYLDFVLGHFDRINPLSHLCDGHIHFANILASKEDGSLRLHLIDNGPSADQEEYHNGIFPEWVKKQNPEKALAQMFASKLYQAVTDNAEEEGCDDLREVHRDYAPLYNDLLGREISPSDVRRLPPAEFNGPATLAFEAGMQEMKAHLVENRHLLEQHSAHLETISPGFVQQIRARLKLISRE